MSYTKLQLDHSVNKSRLHMAHVVHKYTNMSFFLIGYRYLKLNKSFDVALRNGSILRNIHLWTLKDLTILLDRGWIVKSVEQNLLHLNERAINIICRIDKGYDFGHLIEIYIEKKYGGSFHDYNVIDIGTSNGDSSIFFAFWGAKKVVGIEPFVESFQLAVRNVKESGLENKVTLVNKALSAVSGPIVLLTYENSPNANSVDEANMVKIDDKKISRKVEGVKLEDVVNMFQGEGIDLLKLDCEGCEYRALQSVDIKTYRKIERIMLEYHNGLQFLPDLLRTMGYKMSIKSSSEAMGYVYAER